MAPSKATKGPVGLKIGRDKWRIGKEIGNGECGSVHALEFIDNGTSNHVAKLVPLPTKITKQRKTPAERNERVLNNEESIYRNILPDYQGDVIPRLPSYIGPPCVGEVGGFRFLVMERMKGPLWDVVPALLSKTSTGKVSIGPIAKRLLELVSAFHDNKHLLVDVKPENIMLAYSDSKKRFSSKKKSQNKTSAAEDLAWKLRILDLGLVAPWTGSQGHRTDDGLSDIVGTPLYASLNVHDLHTPTRRDDIEAIGYVIAELIIRLVATANGEASKYEGNKKDDIPSYLPWSQGKSDKAIGEAKEKQVSDINSDFYNRMGDMATAKAMKEFFDLARAMKFKEVPDYEALGDIVSALEVAVRSAKKPVAKKPTAMKSRLKEATTTKTTKQASTNSSRAERYNRRAAATKREVGKLDDSEDEVPAKHQKTTGDDGDGDCFVDAAMDIDSDEDDFEDAVESAEEMDWEPFKEKENCKGRTAKSEPGVGVCIVVAEGPAKGNRFELAKGQHTSVIVGKKPRATGADPLECLWTVDGDSSMGNAHVRVELKASKRCTSLKISDLKSGAATTVNNRTLNAGEDHQAFIGESFVIGGTKFKIDEFISLTSLTQSKVSKKNAPPQKKVPLAAVNRGTSSNAKDTGARLLVVDGPYKGDSFSLEDYDVINFGAVKSAAKKGKPVVLDEDAEIEDRHARFQLVVSKKLAKVSVTDLSSSAGTFVNGKQIPKGKEFMAFAGDRVTFGDTTMEVKLD